MYLLHCDQHFCYIKDIDAASKSFGCGECGKLFDHRGILARHVDTCTGGQTKYKYPGGVYHPELTPLEYLKRNGIKVDTKYVYKYRIVYDFEAMMKGIQKTSAKTKYYAEHVLLSASVCSNVPGFRKSQMSGHPRRFSSSDK